MPSFNVPSSLKPYGLVPLLFSILQSAPDASSNFAKSRLPIEHAACNGVSPVSLVALLMSIESCFNNVFTISTCPPIHAT